MRRKLDAVRVAELLSEVMPAPDRPVASLSQDGQGAQEVTAVFAPQGSTAAGSHTATSVADALHLDAEQTQVCPSEQQCIPVQVAVGVPVVVALMTPQRQSVSRWRHATVRQLHSPPPEQHFPMGGTESALQDGTAVSSAWRAVAVQPQ